MSGSGDEGLDIDGNNNTIESNTSTGNGEKGLELDGNDNLIQGNTFDVINVEGERNTMTP